MKFINHTSFFNENIENTVFNNKKYSKEYKLFETFKNNNAIKDRQRKELLFDKGEDLNIDINFRKLKSRLGKKLLSSYVLSELDNLNFTLEKYKYSYHFYYSITRLLWSKNQMSILHPILEKLFNVAIKYKLCVPCRDLAFDLLNIHRSYFVDEKKANYYVSQFTLWKEQCDIFYEVEQFRLEVVKHYYNEIKEIDKDLLSIYIQKAACIKDKMAKIIDIEVYEQANDILCYVYGHQRKYDEIVNTIQGLISFKNSYKFYKKSTEWSIYYNLLLANINLNYFSEAANNLNQLYQFLTTGSRYWLIIKGIEFSLHIKTLRYKDAYDVANEVYLTLGKSNDTIVAKIWQMKLAYIVFIQKILKLDQSVNEENALDFDLKKFVKSTKLLSKDKSGYNLNIKIIKIFNFLTLGEFDNAFEEIEYFNIYKNKYIKKDENPRSRYFISLLQIAANSGFHPVRTLAHAKKIHDKLIKTEFVTTSEYVNNEIIPYEFLWELIIKLLNDKKQLS